MLLCPSSVAPYRTTLLHLPNFARATECDPSFKLAPWAVGESPTIALCDSVWKCCCAAPALILVTAERGVCILWNETLLINKDTSVFWSHKSILCVRTFEAKWTVSYPVLKCVKSTDSGNSFVLLHNGPIQLESPDWRREIVGPNTSSIRVFDTQVSLVAWFASSNGCMKATIIARRA